MVSKNNAISSILVVIGVVTLIIGFFVLFIEGEFLIFISTFISAMLFLGFAEIIKLLQHILYEIKYKGESQEEPLPKIKAVSPDQKFFTIYPVSDDYKEKIQNHYKDKEIKVKNIVSTPFEDYCIVVLGNESAKVVEMKDGEIYELNRDSLESHSNLVGWAQEKKGISL